MKNVILLITLAALIVVGVISARSSKEMFNHNSLSSFALSKIYSTLEEIVKDSNVIISVSISNVYREERRGALVFYVYTAQVNKLYSNLTTQDIVEGGQLEVYRLIGVNTGVGNDMADIVDTKYQVLKQGEYLLFLNGDYDESEKKHILIPNTPNQLFKVEPLKDLLMHPFANAVFTNVTDIDSLPSFTEFELLQAIVVMKVSQVFDSDGKRNF
ncbi:hypothetical protein [Brevibacillus reuszeri]|uniref:hypothetical protein n=1 Tax=Brevibacillus reuszeri TaxID=54915 RepID=UPI00289F9C60|nr:hypothetical protein [Brevibacillus reuszeri]